MPEDTIRRRYASGLANLRELYLPLADTWQLIDNTVVEKPRLIGAGKGIATREVFLPEIWNTIVAEDSAG